MKVYQWGMPQGEPSDAQVEAALEAWEFNDGDSGKDREGAMRAALRAASAVTEQGEN